MTADGDLLMSDANAGGGTEIRRIRLAHGPDGWNVEERWSSNRLKPYFSDYVVHEGHAFGFDGSTSRVSTSRTAGGCGREVATATAS